MKNYTVSNYAKAIDVKNYIRQYRDTEKFIGYCKECGRYNTCWACPPFNFDTEEYLNSYQTAHIIGTKISINADIIKENTGWERCTKISYQMIEEVRLKLDSKLLELEAAFPQSKAFFAGTCHICPGDKCTRVKGKPCIAPERVCPSLESFGFDITKTSSELLNIEMKWSHGGILPEYFTLVSGFSSNDSTVKIEI
jgi:predicted metal-binding protein